MWSKPQISWWRAYWEKTERARGPGCQGAMRLLWAFCPRRAWQFWLTHSLLFCNGLGSGGGEIFMSWARVYLCLMFLEVGVRNETLSSAMVGSSNFMQVNTSLISFFVRELSLRNKKRRLWFDGSWRKHEEESVVCPVHLRSTARKVRRSLRSWSLLAWIELFCAYGRGWGWGMD